MIQHVGNVDYLVVNTLANHKTKKSECELCGKVGILQCPYCRVTYYCSADHAETDQFGIHTTICALLKEIRTPVSVMGSERDRIKREHQKEKIMLSVIETSKREAMKHLVAEEFKLAMPGALQAQRHSIQLFGAHKTELVPAYLLLAEASMGLESYDQAESYLAKARYNVLEHPDCSNSLKSRLHRQWGRLMLVTGRVDEARTELADDIYHSSLDKSPDHIETTTGYFHLANTFVVTKQNDIASRIFDKVIDIWHHFLTEALRRILESSSSSSSSASGGEGGRKKKNEQKKKNKNNNAGGKGATARKGEEDEEDEENAVKEESDDDKNDYDELLDETQVSETIGMISRILSFREETTGPSSQPSARAHHILGLLHLYGGNGGEAASELGKAYDLYKDLEGEECAECVEIKEEIDKYL